MILVGLLVSGVFLAGYLGLKAFSENLLYFYTPSDIVEGKAPINKSFRVGGLVETDSLVREGMQVTFMVTDNIKSRSEVLVREQNSRWVKDEVERVLL